MYRSKWMSCALAIACVVCLACAPGCACVIPNPTEDELQVTGADVLPKPIAGEWRAKHDKLSAEIYLWPRGVGLLIAHEGRSEVGLQVTATFDRATKVLTLNAQPEPGKPATEVRHLTLDLQTYTLNGDTSEWGKPIVFKYWGSKPPEEFEKHLR